MRSIHLLHQFLLRPFTLPFHAQDLIENGSFDVPKRRVKKMGIIEMAKGWTSPTTSKADLFSEGDPLLNAEHNQFGGQAPGNGNNYEYRSQ